jgi:endonuclease YncB( thermonuclease family)
MRAHFVGLAFSTVRTVVSAAALAALVASSAMAAEVEVITGDSFRVAEKQWRIANIDAPRIEGTCDQEARLGVLAQAKLAELLGQGEMEIAPQGGRDRWDRALALVRMNGADVGEKMIAAGLAQRHGQARALCPTRGFRDHRGDLPPGSTPMTPQTPSTPHMN